MSLALCIFIAGYVYVKVELPIEVKALPKTHAKKKDKSLIVWKPGG